MHNSTTNQTIKNQIKKFLIELKNGKENSNLSNLSPSPPLPSPSLDAEEPRDRPPRISPGSISSLRCTVKEFLPFLPKPIRLFRP